jgi:hypothetical protein
LYTATDSTFLARCWPITYSSRLALISAERAAWLAASPPLLLHLLADDVVAELDALVADEHGRAGDQLAHLVLALAAERAVQQLAVVVRPG